MSKGWKYGLIKVDIEDEGTEYVEQTNLLVELYPLGDEAKGEELYNTYCNARLMTLEELKMATADIERDGINEYFYDNGNFEWKVCGKCYDGDWAWTPNQGQQKPKTTKVKETKDGETFIELTPAVLSQMGWVEGDDLEFETVGSDSFIITRVDKLPIPGDDEQLDAIYGGE